MVPRQTQTLETQASVLPSLTILLESMCPTCQAYLCLLHCVYRFCHLSNLLRTLPSFSSLTCATYLGFCRALDFQTKTPSSCHLNVDRVQSARIESICAKTLITQSKRLPSFSFRLLLLSSQLSLGLRFLERSSKWENRFIGVCNILPLGSVRLTFRVSFLGCAILAACSVLPSSLDRLSASLAHIAGHGPIENHSLGIFGGRMTILVLAGLFNKSNDVTLKYV